MNHIETIHINNFKFFGESEPIQVGGKHLLLYGENGSGKSSLFWALYTLLESVNKSDEAISRYFDLDDDSNLVNVYASPVEPVGFGSSISLTLTNSTTYRIAINDFSAKAQPNAKATLFGSDFLNYRFMFKLHDCRHKDEIDLLPLFQKEVFPYIQTRNRFDLLHESKSTQNAIEIWDDLQKVPVVLDGTSVSDDDRNRTQQEYADKLRAFVTELKELFSYINANGNPILRDKLGYPTLRFEIGCEQKFILLKGGGELSGRPSDIPDGPMRITLTVPEYEGLEYVVRRPQSFLNEAKLTAIGIAIRLAIVGRRLDYAGKADFQLLVLDDLLISLDMSNRRTVLNLLLSQYAETFQLFILTHDRAFFEKTKRQISARNEESNWTYLEMYEDRRNLPARPFIKRSDSFIESAEQQLIHFDFPAASNYLRKACEQLLTELLPLRSRLDGNGEKIWQLGTLLVKAEEYYKSLPLPVTPIQEIQEHLKTLLNPLSHADLESEIYRQELEAVFNAYKALAVYKNLDRFSIAQEGEKLMFELLDQRNQDRLWWHLTFNGSLDVLRLPNQADQLSYCNFDAVWFLNGEQQPSPIRGNTDVKKFYEDACRKTGNVPDPFGIFF